MTLTTEKGPAVLEHHEADAHLNSAEDHMNTQTVAPRTDNVGASLRRLRHSHNLRIEQVAIVANTTVSYLTKVEADELIPAKTYVAQVTEAICKLMAPPARSCTRIGCLGTNHSALKDTDEGWHTATEIQGDEWRVSVDWFDAQDTKWVVYGELKDAQTALDADKVESFYDAWKRATAYAAMLNRSGYVNEVR